MCPYRVGPFLLAHGKSHISNNLYTPIERSANAYKYTQHIFGQPASFVTIYIISNRLICSIRLQCIAAYNTVLTYCQWVGKGCWHAARVLYPYFCNI